MISAKRLDLCHRLDASFEGSDDYADLPGYLLTTARNVWMNDTPPDAWLNLTQPNFSEEHTPPVTLEKSKYYLTTVVNPAFCVCGILGNLLNILVLSQRQMQATMNGTMEQAAQTGLIALAVSDLLYCLSSVCDAFIGRPQTFFTSKTFVLYLRMYRLYVQNVFMNTSTWLTVIMAVGRYAAICRPLHARHLVASKATRIAVVTTFITWVLLQLPTIWQHSLTEVPCPKQVYYLLDHGMFLKNNELNKSFTYIWSLLGYFIPVILLAYCNVHLIKALKESTQIRRLYRVSPRATSSGSRVTPTLVAIVCMYLLLVSPSEILQFFNDTISKQHVEAFNVVLVVCNVLQTINFSCNFILYCIVNVHFRNTWKGLVFCIARRRHHRPFRGMETRQNSTSVSNKGSLMANSTLESVM